MSTLRLGLLAVALMLAGCNMMKPASGPAPMPRTYLVFFHQWNATLTPEAKTIVDQASAKVKEQKPSTVTIAGYTDNVGTAEENKHIAEQRIQTVKDAMVQDGVDPNLFLRIPLGPADDTAGKTGDRRIEIRLTYDK